VVTTSLKPCRFGYWAHHLISTQERLRNGHNLARQVLYKEDQKVEPTDGVEGGEHDEYATTCGQRVPNSNHKTFKQKRYIKIIYSIPSKRALQRLEGKRYMCSAQVKPYL
jgi:hypothetical protein